MPGIRIKFHRKLRMLFGLMEAILVTLAATFAIVPSAVVACGLATETLVVFKTSMIFGSHTALEVVWYFVFAGSKMVLLFISWESTLCTTGDGPFGDLLKRFMGNG